MNKTAAIIAAAMLTITGCSNTNSSEPEPDPDQRVIDTARKYQAFDRVSDLHVTEMGKEVCGVLDAYGPEEGTDLAMALIEQNVTNPGERLAVTVVSYESIRAYCPEHTAGAEEWVRNIQY